MAELSKQQLKSDNNLDFPNNNIGAITPAILRSFNADMIDSNVNQTIYNADSASWTSDIDVLQAFSASQYNLNKTLATTGSNTFVGNQIVSGTIFTNALDTTTGNTLTIYSDLDVSGSFVSNLQAGYVWLGNTNGRAVAVPSSSIAAGGSTDLSALNAFTQSQETKNTAVGTYTASLNAYTASNNTKWNTIGLLTGSYATTGSNTFVATQTINADLIVSGTISAYKINTTIESSSVIFSSGSNILGDSTSDTQTLNGTVIVSGSQRITGSTSTTDAITINKSGGNGLVLSNSGIQSAGAIVSNDSISIYASGAPNVTVQANANGTGSQYPGMTVTVAPELYPTDIYGGFSINSSGAPGSQPTIGGMITQTYSTEYGTANTFMIVGENATTAIGFPSGAIELWKPTNVKSGLSITGSVGITGSATISGNQTIGGTQTITGAQTLNGNSNVVSGSINFNGTARFNNTASLYNTIRLNNNISPDTNFLTVDVASGSIVLQSPNAGGGISGLAHLSSSAVSTQVNLIFKNSTTAADTIISGSNNIFTNPAAPTAGFKRYFGGSGNIVLSTGSPQISGSMGFSPTMNNNIWSGIGGSVIMRGPVSSSAWTISNNIGTNTGQYQIGVSAGSNAEKIVSGLTIAANIGSVLPAIQAYKTPLSASVTFTGTTGNGQISMNCDSSSIQVSGNGNFGTTTINNSYFPSTINNQTGLISLSNNTLFGTSIINASGSDTTFTAVAARGAFNNVIGGYSTIGLVLNGDNSSLNSSVIVGGGLVVTGSNSKVAAATANNDFGSAFLGRWNDVNGSRATSGPTVFAVGTGTSTTRKTGFLIDSGSNTFVEGTLNVSGSTSMTGSLSINGSTIVSGSVRGNVLTQTITSTTASFDFSTANFFELTLVNSTNTRVEATNVQPGQTINVLVKQASTPGNGTISFSAPFDFPAVSPYTASVIADAKDILTFVTFANTGSIYAAAVKNLI